MAGNTMQEKLLEGVAWLPEIFAGDTGHILKSFNLKQTDGGWLLVVSAQRKGGNRIVAFFGAARPEGCVEQFLYALWHRPGIKWLPDKYAK